VETAVVVAAESEVIAEIDQEPALIQETKIGQLTTFEQLVQKYDRVVLTVTQVILGNREEAQEATLESFFTAYKKLSQWQEGERFSMWLMRIVITESLSRLAAQPGAREYSPDSICSKVGESLPSKVVDWVADPKELYDSVELREILSTSLRSLPLSSRMVFGLRDIVGSSLRDTAALLGLSLATVRERLLQARLHLRERLAPYFEK
jgi:RNA polymerase sigma-70 factor (ECF subfamily)